MLNMTIFNFLSQKLQYLQRMERPVHIAMERGVHVFAELCETLLTYGKGIELLQRRSADIVPGIGAALSAPQRRFRVIASVRDHAAKLKDAARQFPRESGLLQCEETEVQEL